MVHGLFGWGDEDGLSKYFSNWELSSGDMPEYLSRKGYDLYVASVGPVSSAHDRCCELFAQLTGSRVDYGQAHADKSSAEFAAVGSSLTHSRYRRDYTGRPGIDGRGPIYDRDGKVIGWHDNKINLVGHSFGGPTCLTFLDLLANGDTEEIAWGKAQAAHGGNWHDYVSPLFWGDYRGEYLVNSVTSVAGVLNGTTFITANDDMMELAKPLVTLLASLTGKTDINALYDFQLEQFGITRLPGGSVSDSICTLRSLGLTRGTDHAFYDLTTEGTNRLKTGWKTYDNVYCFSYSCDKSYRAGGAYMPDADMFFLLIPFSMTMGSYHDAGEVILNVDGTVYGSVDGSWMPNDGMVNTISERYPFGTAHKTYNVNAIESGLWNVHPDADEDHFSIIGSFIGPRPVTTRALFDGILSDIRRTKPIFDESRVNVGTQANKLAAPRSLSGRATVLKKASLAWKSVGPGCYYEVYRSNAENGEYTRIDTTLLTVYTDLTVSARRTYWYKIVAVPLTSGAVSSEFSQAVSVKL